MQLRLLDTPLAPDKPLWTSQEAYNKQAGCCRQVLSGPACGGGRAWVDVWGGKKHKIIQQISLFSKSFFDLKVFNWNFSSNCSDCLWFPFIPPPPCRLEKELWGGAPGYRGGLGPGGAAALSSPRGSATSRGEAHIQELFIGAYPFSLSSQVQKVAGEELQCRAASPVWINYSRNYSLSLIYYLSHISQTLYITLSCHITQVNLGSFSPHLASLKAYS